MVRRLVFVVIVLAVLASCSPEASISKPSRRPPLPSVDTKATPSGWIPVNYGDAQLSVPSNWVVDIGPCPGPGSGTLYLHGPEPGYFCQAEPVDLNQAWIYPLVSPLPSQEVPTVINGIDVYSLIEGYPAFGGYAVPSLQIQVEAQGPLANEVLETLTHSPRAVALAPGSSPALPNSWRRLSYGGLSVAAPRSWPVENGDWQLGLCQLVPIALDLDQQNVVTTASGTVRPVAASCPAFSDYADLERLRQGLVIDPGPYGPLSSGSTFDKCMSINHLSVCPTATDPYGVLVAAVHVPGRKRPVAIEIGLAGNGIIARTILHSLRAAESPDRIVRIDSSDP